MTSLIRRNLPLLITCAFILPLSNSFAQPSAHVVSSTLCECVPTTDSTKGIFVSDTVVFDTCGLGQDELSCAEKAMKFDEERIRFSARKAWYIEFTAHVIDLPEYQADTLILLQWKDIDSSHLALRLSFQQLELQFGAYKLRKEFPQSTSGWMSQRFFI